MSPLAVALVVAFLPLLALAVVLTVVAPVGRRQPALVPVPPGAPATKGWRR